MAGDEIATEFARAEGFAFVKGTGTNQPLGYLSSPNATTADGVRPMGTLQTIGTGVAGGFPASNPADKLIDLVQTLRSPYRQGAVFLMNSATTALRWLKTMVQQGLFLRRADPHDGSRVFVELAPTPARQCDAISARLDRPRSSRKRLPVFLLRGTATMPRAPVPGLARSGMGG